MPVHSGDGSWAIKELPYSGIQIREGYCQLTSALEALASAFTAGTLPVFGRGHINLFLEHCVEGRFRVKADLLGDGDDRVMFFCRISQHLLSFLHAVRADEVNEGLP